MRGQTFAGHCRSPSRVQPASDSSALIRSGDFLASRSPLESAWGYSASASAFATSRSRSCFRSQPKLVRFRATFLSCVRSTLASTPSAAITAFTMGSDKISGIVGSDDANAFDSRWHDLNDERVTFHLHPTAPRRACDPTQAAASATTISRACAAARATACSAACGPNAVPSTRITSTFVIPRKPSMFRSHGTWKSSPAFSPE